MKQECCDECVGVEDMSGDGIGGAREYCKNPDCTCHQPASQLPEECACGGEIKEAATHTKDHCKAVNNVPSIKEQVEQPEVGLEARIANTLFKYHYPNMELFLQKDDEAMKEIADALREELASQKAQEAERVGEELEKILHTYWTNPFTGYNCGRHLKLKGALMDLLAALHQDT